MGRSRPRACWQRQTTKARVRARARVRVRVKVRTQAGGLQAKCYGSVCIWVCLININLISIISLDRSWAEAGRGQAGNRLISIIRLIN